MVDYVPLTPQQIARRMRLPENDPNYVNDPNRAMLAPLMIYGGALGPEISGALGGAGRAAPSIAKAINPTAEAATGSLSAADMALIKESYPEFAAELEAHFANASPQISQSAGNVAQKIPEYLSSARDSLLRTLGYQTPAARQAAARLVEPGAAEAATTGSLTAGQMAGRTALAGTPLLAASVLAPSSIPGMSPLNAIRPSSTYMDQNTPSDLEAYAGNARLPTSVLDRSDSDVSPHGAVHLAKQTAAPAPASAPMPMARPSNADLRAYNPQTGPSSGGGLAGLFNKPLSTAQLNQQSIDNPDDPGAWMRAERQYASTHKDNPNFDLTKLDPDTGMKRGGTVSGKSEKMPDPVHKALEIIHHLLMRH